jgi:prophage tail gpP-like protein
MALSLAAVRVALDNDAVQVVINGTSYQGWTDVDIDSDILNPADSFVIGGTIPKAKPSTAEVRAGAPGGAFDDFREGKFCDVYVGLDRQMSGVIDEVQFKGERATTRIKISGRDKGAFLADSEAKHIRAAKYTVKTLIQALIDPAWGIRNVIFSNEENRRLVLGKRDKTKPRSSDPDFLQPLPRERTKVDPGQRIASILDMHTRRLGLTWWLTAGGDLFIGKPNYKQEAAYKFTAGAFGSQTPTNVESWEVTRSTAERFSELKVYGQGDPNPNDSFDTSKAPSKFEGTARDPDLVERGVVRKTIISDCDVLSNTRRRSARTGRWAASGSAAWLSR